jgi:hypothetical protein
LSNSKVRLRFNFWLFSIFNLEKNPHFRKIDLDLWFLQKYIENFFPSFCRWLKFPCIFSTVEPARISDCQVPYKKNSLMSCSSPTLEEKMALLRDPRAEFSWSLFAPPLSTSCFPSVLLFIYFPTLNILGRLNF